MVFVRKIKKGDKVYSYLYESKRVDGKVKSIYVGRADNSKKNRIETEDDALKNFNDILIKVNDFIKNNDISSASEHYNELLNEYNNVSSSVNDEKKLELFNKTKAIYERLNELNENS